MVDDKLQGFINRIKTLKDSISNEETTKTSLIMPFFSLLGYDVFDPTEFVPEYTADVGLKKGEKVDYAIMVNSEPTILIEAKSVTEKLEKHDSQLFRYFGTSKAKFAILTNGICYKFYTDLEEPNKMDLTPFLAIDLLNLRESDVFEINKFAKDKFDVSSIVDTASDLKYCGLIRNFLKTELNSPSNEFVKFIMTSGIYEGRVYQNILDRFKPIVKKSFIQYVNELVNEKIKNALNNTEDSADETAQQGEPEKNIEANSAIVTTAEELQSYYIIKSFVGSVIDLARCTYKDTESYFAVLLDSKVTKWICRVYLKEHSKYIVIQSGGENKKYVINDLSDIYKLNDVIKKRVKELID